MLQPLVRRRHHTDVDLDGRVATHALERMTLEHAQELRLRAIDPALKQAGSQASDDPGTVRKLRRRQVQQPSGQQRRPERGKKAGRVNLLPNRP